MNFPERYLLDDKGRPSAMRLYALICVIAGVGLAALATMMESWIGATVAMSMIGAAFTGKVAQKISEDVTRT